MKNINFKRQQSVFQTLEEPKRKKSGFNFDRMVYFLVAGGIVAAALFAFGDDLFFVEADGHVLFEKVFVRMPADIQVTCYNHKEGDVVKEGDSLFCYNDEDEAQWLSRNMERSSGNNWYQQELISAQSKRDLNEIEIAQLQILIENLQSKQKQLVNEIGLDLQPKSKLENLEKEIFETQLNLDKLLKEKEYFSHYIGELRAQKGKTAYSFSSAGTARGTKIFRSPIDGTITRIHNNNFEMVMKGEEILTIHKEQNIFIKGFFEQEDLKYLKVGDIVDLEFPDGTSSEGKIEKFYFATYQISPEFQEKYEPLKRTLGVDIIPTSKEELAKWKAFYKMSVTIRKSKF